MRVHVYCAPREYELVRLRRDTTHTRARAHTHHTRHTRSALLLEHNLLFEIRFHLARSGSRGVARKTRRYGTVDTKLHARPDPPRTRALPFSLSPFFSVSPLAPRTMRHTRQADPHVACHSPRTGHTRDRRRCAIQRAERVTSERGLRTRHKPAGESAAAASSPRIGARVDSPATRSVASNSLMGLHHNTARNCYI